MQITEIEEAINAAEKMVGWNVSVEIERVEELVLRNRLLTHHRDAPVVGLRFRLGPTAMVQRSSSTE